VLIALLSGAVIGGCAMVGALLLAGVL